MNDVKKKLKDLNLLDRFLFAEAMEDPVILKNTLEIILGREVVLKYLPQAEKEQRTSPLNRFVKLDVWAWDETDTVYDTEVQKEDTGNLPKRSRLYQGIIDSKLLDPGEVDFNALNTVYIIMIMPLDLFGQGLYQYTFQMQCQQIPGLLLADGAFRIFLNTHGTNKNGVSIELTELLQYMEHTTEEVSKKCASPRIHEMQERIEAIKSSEEIGVKFMQEWEEKIIEKQKAREEGLAVGKAEGLAAGKIEGLAAGKAEGLAAGKAAMLTLVSAMVADGLSQEIPRLQNESDFLEKMLEKYGISL